MGKSSWSCKAIIYHLFISLSFVCILLTGVSFAENKVVLIPIFKREGVGDAIVENVLEGKTYSSNEGQGLTGTMPNTVAVDITPGTSDQGVPAGYHDGNGKVKGDPDLVSGSIMYGIDIFGVAGTGQCIKRATRLEMVEFCKTKCASDYGHIGEDPVYWCGIACEATDMLLYNNHRCPGDY